MPRVVRREGGERPRSVMSRVDPQQGLMPSILDRLIDADAGGTPWRRAHGAGRRVEAVHRAWEALLNPRRSHAGPPEAFAGVGRWVFGYGLPDLASPNAVPPEQRREIGRALEAVIARFEPRLRDPR